MFLTALSGVQAFLAGNQAFQESLTIMWKGMLGIFTVMIVLLVCVKLLSVLVKDKKNEK